MESHWVAWLAIVVALTVGSLARCRANADECERTFGVCVDLSIPRFQ